MRSTENVKLPPIVNTDSNEREKHEGKGRSSESESNSSSTTSSRRLRTFKQVVNIVGKNSKWTRDVNKDVQEDQLKSITAQDKRLTFNVSGKLNYILWLFCDHHKHGKALRYSLFIENTFTFIYLLYIF